ncbi:MAG: carboxymuconolactone decarboxylase family protein [Chloroflexi bacterium]|nr:carboxymuconolactone decarboxylase family protein [Chloroflexota bacterium]
MSRVPYITREDLPEEKRTVYDQISSHRGNVARPFQALLNSPDLAGKVAAVGEHLRFQLSTLTDEIREIVTLTTAREMDSQYEWSRHVPWAQAAGVREEVVNAIRDGTSLRRLLPKEAVFVQFTQELLRDRKVRDTTYSAVEHLLGMQGTVDLVVIIGYYALLGYTMAALEVELEPEFPPLLPQ